MKEYTQELANGLYFRAWRKWGSELQINTLVEEMAEFIHAYMRAKRNNVMVNCAMLEELADVEIMVEQMKVILELMPNANNDGSLYDSVICEKQKKLERLEKMLDEKMS